VDVSFVGGHHFTWRERRLIQAVADTAARDVRRVLAGLAPKLMLRVQAGHQVIQETGETAEARPPNVVSWTVDPSRSGGVEQIVTTQLRGTLFHEFLHLVRAATTTVSLTLMDEVVSEGLATAFERDLAGSPVPWGAYPRDVGSWLTEVVNLPPDAPREQWMFRHPDGRRSTR
jgi:hypothetical protein